MTLLMQTHGGDSRSAKPPRKAQAITEALVPAVGDVAVDEAADFGFLFPPSGNPDDYLPNDVLVELDALGDLVVPPPDAPETSPNVAIPAVITYWGQFLDHELTARTDRETEMSKIETPIPSQSAADIETKLKNARTPRFDLDSVYGGSAIGSDMSPNVAKVISGMRHPTMRNKMRVGTTLNTDPDDGPLPDGLDEHRDLPRFGQVEQSVRDAYLALVKDRMSPDDFASFQASLAKRAIIGDARNDENLIVAQFHLSFLRFHNRVVDFLTANDTGWIADFHSAQELTRLHYQWLIAEVFLKTVCDPVVVQRVLDEKARHFYDFRDDYYGRNTKRSLGNVIPLEFSTAAYRFGHTMVRGVYDYNKNFGRPGGIIPNAPFNLLFTFTGGGGFFGKAKLPANWVIDWTRFIKADASFAEEPQRTARALDTELAPPLGNLQNEAGSLPNGSDLQKMFRHLAKRNLRRGFSLRLPTGQALHRHLKAAGAVTSQPITNVGTLVPTRPALKAFLENSSSRLHERTPLWFYVLAEAEAAGGTHLGELGSWIVASTFIAVLLSDPDSALSRDFTPAQSPLRMPDASPIDTLEKWMKFAVVLE